MSIHPSLRPAKGKGHRSVFKRFERIKMLLDKDKWKEGISVFGLPKVKSIKIKVKKEKTEKAATEAAATPEAGAKAVAAAPAKKEQAKEKEPK